MNANGALVFTPPAKQIAQRKMQLRGIGIVLDCLNESVNGFVLLLVEQKIQPFEIGPGCLSIVDAQLAQVQSRGQPTQAKCSGQANQNPNEIKFHD